jgi:hypothetical protein
MILIQAIPPLALKGSSITFIPKGTAEVIIMYGI